MNIKDSLNECIIGLHAVYGNLVTRGGKVILKLSDLVNNSSEVTDMIEDYNLINRKDDRIPNPSVNHYKYTHIEGGF